MTPTILLILAFLFLAAPALGGTQAGWYKQIGPAVAGSSESYDTGSVLNITGSLKMWLSVWSSDIAASQCVDFYRWTPPTVVLKPVGGWEGYVRSPWVLLVNSTYYMWYTAGKVQFTVIGFATSTDGILWNRPSSAPNLVASQPWENGHVEAPSVVYDWQDHTFKMFYTGGDRLAPNGIGMAFSHDGQNWEKLPTNPVFINQPSGAWWEHVRVTYPAVVLTPKEGFTLFYTGYSNDSFGQIGIARTATSQLTAWKRHPKNPIVFPESRGWDSSANVKPAPTSYGDGWGLWYTGQNFFERSHSIGAAFHEGLDLGF